MTCIVKSYGCSCASGECQTPHYAILEQAMFSSRDRLIVRFVAAFVSVSSATFFVMALVNGGM
jgi:hypothetical protein